MANTLRVQPDSIFSVQWTAYMIFMVLLGGLGTFEGPVLGALVLFGIQQEFQDQGSWYLVGLGAVAIIVTLLFPRGIWGAIVDRFNLRLLPVGYNVRGLVSSLGRGGRG
jgi:branched-chain amino acid transport system permease protein